MGESISHDMNVFSYLRVSRTHCEDSHFGEVYSFGSSKDCVSPNSQVLSSSQVVDLKLLPELGFLVELQWNCNIDAIAPSVNFDILVC